MNKKIIGSLLILSLLLTGCQGLAGTDGHTESSAVSASVSGSSLETTEASTESSFEIEAGAANKESWEKAAFAGISFEVPSDWEVKKSDDTYRVMYSDPNGNDFFTAKYQEASEITEQDRKDSLRLGNALDKLGFAPKGSTQSKADDVGTQPICKYFLATTGDDGNAYEAIFCYIPVGDLGLVTLTAAHATQGDTAEDESILNTILSSLAMNPDSVLTVSKDMGITKLGVLPVELYNAQDVVLTANKVENTDSGPVITLSITNGSKEDVYFSIASISINGYVVSGRIKNSLEKDNWDIKGHADAGENENAYLVLEDLDEYGITKVGEVSVSFYVNYGDEYSDDSENTDVIVFDAVTGYTAADYVTYKPSDTTIYEDDNVCVSYEGLKKADDGKVRIFVLVQNKTKEILKTSLSNSSIDGASAELSLYTELYPENTAYSFMYSSDSLDLKEGQKFSGKIEFTAYEKDYTKECSFTL